MKIPLLSKLALALGVGPKSIDPGVEMPKKGSRPSRGPAWYRRAKGIPDPWGGGGEDQPPRQRTRARMRRSAFAAVTEHVRANVEAVRTGWLESDRRSRRAKARQAVRLGAA